MRWPSYPLWTLCDVVIGATPSRRKSEYWGGKHTWVTVSELNGRTLVKSKEHITDEGVKNSASKLVPAGTLLFSFKLSIGKMAFSGVDLYTNEAIAALPIRPGVPLDKHYLYYALSTSDLSVGAHAAVKGKLLNKEKLKRIEVPLPPLSEQRRIVELLDQANALRKKRAEADEKASRILQSLFYEMFGDPATNPMEWTTITFGEVVDIGTQLVDPNQREFNDLYHIGGEHIDADTGRTRGYQSVADSKLRSNKFTFNEEHVLYSKIRPYLNKVAFPRFAGVCSADIYPLKPKDCRITQWFIVALLRSSAFLSYAAVHSDRLRIPKLNKNQLSSFEFPLPDEGLVRKFTARAEQLDKSLDHVLCRANKLEDLYTILLQRAFSGVLTAKWRESHMEQLLAEMEKQAKVLEKSSRSSVPKKSTTKKRHGGHDMYNKAALAAYITDRCHSEEHPMGRVKLAKLFYLSQKKAEIQLTDMFTRRAAGPLDDQIHKFLNLAKKQGWVELGRAKGDFKPVRPGKDLSKVVPQVQRLLTTAKAYVDTMLDEMRGWKYTTLERWATVLEAAQLLLEEGKEISVNSVKSVIFSEKEWAQKLDRAEFSDDHINATLSGLKKQGFLKEVAT